MTLTNIQLTQKTSKKGNTRTILEDMGIEDYFWKLRAEGKSYQRVAEILNKEHPRADGGKWQWRSLMQSARILEKRKIAKKELIANEDDSVARAIAEETINTTKRLRQLDTLLDSWLLKADTSKTKSITCKKCGSVEKINLFDPDKAIKVADQMRRLLMTSQSVAKSLPDVPHAKQGGADSLSSLNLRKFINKLVDEGALIVADDEKLKEYGV